MDIYYCVLTDAEYLLVVSTARMADRTAYGGIRIVGRRDDDWTAISTRLGRG